MIVVAPAGGCADAQHPQHTASQRNGQRDRADPWGGHTGDVHAWRVPQTEEHDRQHAGGNAHRVTDHRIPG